MSDYVKCPFCGDDDFDLIGLKIHLYLHCKVFDVTPTTDAPESDEGGKRHDPA